MVINLVCFNILNTSYIKFPSLLRLIYVYNLRVINEEKEFLGQFELNSFFYLSEGIVFSYLLLSFTSSCFKTLDLSGNYLVITESCILLRLISDSVSFVVFTVK